MDGLKSFTYKYTRCFILHYVCLGAFSPRERFQVKFSGLKSNFFTHVLLINCLSFGSSKQFFQKHFTSRDN